MITCPKKDPYTGEYKYRGQWFESFEAVENAIDEHNNCYENSDAEYDRRKDEEYIDGD